MNHRWGNWGAEKWNHLSIWKRTTLIRKMKSEPSQPLKLQDTNTMAKGNQIWQETCKGDQEANQQQQQKKHTHTKTKGNLAHRDIWSKLSSEGLSQATKPCPLPVFPIQFQRPKTWTSPLTFPSPTSHPGALYLRSVFDCRFRLRSTILQSWCLAGSHY